MLSEIYNVGAVYLVTDGEGVLYLPVIRGYGTRITKQGEGAIGEGPFWSEIGYLLRIIY